VGKSSSGSYKLFGGKKTSGIEATKVRTPVTWFLNKTNIGIQLILCRMGGKLEVSDPLSLIPLLSPPVRPSLQSGSRCWEQGWMSTL